MKALSASVKQRFWEEVRREFPDDEMMQQIHFVRLLHHDQTKDLTARERVRFYQTPVKKRRKTTKPQRAVQSTG